MKNQKRNLAAIDVGTNSFHLIVCELDLSLGRFKIFDREKEIVRLGSGSTDMKYLADSAIERGVRTLKRFKAIADSFNAMVRAVATSAVREALNQEEFLRRVKTETGIKVEIASGVEEARMIYLGALQALPLYHKKVLLIDVGGGSTEFVTGKERSIGYSNSLKIGAVRLTERFFGKEPDAKSTKECRKYVQGMLAPISREIRKRRYEVAVGSSGTICNLASIIRRSSGDEDDENAPINNFTFRKAELFEAVERILDCRDSRELLEIDGLDPLRADIIVAGAIIVEQIFRELEIKELTVSEFALREGIVRDTMEKLSSSETSDHVFDIRRQSVHHFAVTFNVELPHARHVADLALQVFDQTKRLHGLGAEEREFLEAAATLHEVGLFVSHAQHHRHSYYLIRNSEMLGFSENEKEVIANVARYHRKSHPKLKHEGFRRLSQEDQAVVTKLAAILRVADGLDRTHSANVKRVRCHTNNGTLNMTLHHSKKANLDLEVWGAERKKDLFEQTFHVHLNLKDR